MWSSIIKYQTSTQIYPIPSNPCFVFPNYGIHGSVCLVEKKYINWARAAQKHFQNFNAETLLNPMQWPWNWLKLTQVFLGFRMGFFLGAGEPRAQIWLRIEKNDICIFFRSTVDWVKTYSSVLGSGVISTLGSRSSDCSNLIRNWKYEIHLLPVWHCETAFDPRSAYLSVRINYHIVIIGNAIMIEVSNIIIQPSCQCVMIPKIGTKPNPKLFSDTNFFPIQNPIFLRYQFFFKPKYFWY